MIRIGSLCTGYGGLDQAVTRIYGGQLTFTADIDPASCRLISHRYPGILNMGDIKTADWTRPDAIDILTAGFPCFPAGTFILTEKGHMPVEKITPGIRVLTHKGRWKHVRTVMIRPDAPLWRIKAPHPVLTTAEHPFYTRTQGRQWNNARRRYDRVLGAPEWKPAQSLTPGDRVGSNLPPETIPSREDPSWWWLAGRYLADGWPVARTRTGAGNPVTSEQGRIILACGRGKEHELRARLADAGLHATEAPERTAIKFHIIHQEFYRFCRQMGHGAAGKKPSPEALALPPGLAEEFLAGWLAGDGCREETGWSGISISKPLILGMALIAFRARGVACSIEFQKRKPETVIEGRTVRQHDTWRLHIPFRNRKHMTEDGTAWFRILSAEHAGMKATVYNISVEDDESYVADGLIVHNCQPVSGAGKKLGEADERWLWPDTARAIADLRPRLVLLENVAALLGRGAATVVRSLAEMGYVGSYGIVSAADTGAPHLRERWFAVAYPDGVSSGTGPVEAGDGLVASVPGDEEPVGGGVGEYPFDADTDGTGLEGNPWPEHPDGESPPPDGDPDWGVYVGKIRRWERILGRPAPLPVVPGRTRSRLNPVFVEWTMGLPEGWVCNVPGLSYREQLHLLGNGVVPRQAELAIRLLTPPDLLPPNFSRTLTP